MNYLRRPRRASERVASLVFGLACVVAGSAFAAADVLPKPPAAFKGKIDPSRDKSTPDWPQPLKAAAGAPNVVLVLIDDAGFGATSTFGGVVQTPTLQHLADNGLRYNQFHVNSLCAPTRGALLTGRNNHQIGFGTNSPAGYPGYTTVIPKSAASVAEVLRQNGYSTAGFGKWHNTPAWEVSAAGPFDRWPTGIGFEYWYGFHGGSTSQYEPQLYRNTVAVEAPAKPEQGYHLTTDLADDAIRWLDQHEAAAPDRPFFVYIAPGATHSPHHAPQEWVDRYKGKFDQGWDKQREEVFARQKQLGVIPANTVLTPRPPELPAWDSLPAQERKLLARQAEVYAGFYAHVDHEVGRVLQAIRDKGQADNTLVLYVAGDNGAAIAGGREGRDATATDGGPAPLAERLTRVDELGSKSFSNFYASAWAWADNTPFQYGKTFASHLGGARDPLVVSWPAKIKDKGGLRSQFSHLVDIAPTIYAAAGVKFPRAVNGVEQLPLEGFNLAQTFDDAKAPSGHRVQYFEMVGNRGIYKDGWWAASRYQESENNSSIWARQPVGPHAWELYNLNEDFSQARDLAAKNPAKLKELVALFDREAKRNQVYPLVPTRNVTAPYLASGKRVFSYRKGVSRLPARVAPELGIVPHTVTVDLEVPAAGAEGVILAEGGRHGGFSLYVKDGRVVYEHNAFGAANDKLVASEPLPTGKVKLVFDYRPDAKTQQDAAGRPLSSGAGRLSVNGKPVGTARFDRFGNFGETLEVGSDLGSPVSRDYAAPFRFTGQIEKVAIELR